MSEGDTEAGKVAAQLKRLHEAGAIRSKEDAAFYARFIVTFRATFIGWPAKPAGSEGRNVI